MTDAVFDHHLRQALRAYQSPERTHYSLHRRNVSNLEAVIYFLTKAHQQQPAHINVLLTLATMHTFRGNIDAACQLYHQCLTRSRSTTARCRALTYLLTWYHYQHARELTALYLSRLQQLDRPYAELIERFLMHIETVLSQPVITRSDQLLAHAATGLGTGHVLVTFGYQLLSDGTLAPPLRARLMLTKALARLFPASPVLVTGGMPRQGITEARQMKRWLCQSGIDEARVIEEDQATNTLDNARLSLNLLRQHPIEHATVISNAGHVQRAQLLFQLLQLSSGPSRISVDHCAVPEPHTAPFQQACSIRRNCYIDALRAIGLPAFDCPPYISL